MAKLNPLTFDRNLRNLLEEEQRLQKRLATTQEQLTAVSQRIAAYRLVSRECATVPTGSTALVTAHELQGKELLDALVLIAERHDGELNTYQYRRILKDAGILTGGDSSQLRDALAGFEQFEKTAEQGRWRLVQGSSEPSIAATESPPAGDTTTR